MIDFKSLDSWLGKDYDGEVAKRFKISRASVQGKRKRKGIPPYGGDKTARYRDTRPNAFVNSYLLSRWRVV